MAALPSCCPRRWSRRQRGRSLQAGPVSGRRPRLTDPTRICGPSTGLIISRHAGVGLRCSWPGLSTDAEADRAGKVGANGPTALDDIRRPFQSTTQSTWPRSSAHVRCPVVVAACAETACTACSLALGEIRQARHASELPGRHRAGRTLRPSLRVCDSRRSTRTYRR
jgi:hypothetical protein